MNHIRDSPKRHQLGGRKEIFDQLTSHFPQFDQLLPNCVIESCSSFLPFFIDIDQIVGQKVDQIVGQLIKLSIFSI